MNQKKPTEHTPSAFWSFSEEVAFQTVHSSRIGLTHREAKKRLERQGPNLLKAPKRFKTLRLFFNQFTNPVILILIGAAALAWFLYDKADAGIILAIILASGLLGFWQEKGAMNALEQLLKMVKVKATVLRDNRMQDIPLENIVSGDILVFNAGDIIPADCLLIESKDLFVDESTLTGEAFPIEKEVALLPANTPLNGRRNCLFMGSHILSGNAKALVMNTGRQAEFGKIAENLRTNKARTEFEQEMRHFGNFLIRITLILLILLFAVRMFLHKPFLESFFFALALAVGLTPQLLPAIISINLARGAKKMASRSVIVKRLVSIENLGKMDILCVDKTGTITEGKARLHASVDYLGNANEKAFFYAYLNAFFQSGYSNPIDHAIIAAGKSKANGYSKLDEIPYDFVRKRLSVLVGAPDSSTLMVCKGAVASILPLCTMLETASGSHLDINSHRQELETLFQKLSSDGFRLIAIAYRTFKDQKKIAVSDEKDLIFSGYVVLEDPLKKDIKKNIDKLQKRGVSLRIITGDSIFTAGHIAKQVGLNSSAIMTGQEIAHMSTNHLMKKMDKTLVFAEIEPHQKELIISLLKKKNHVVGFLGDGVNDALAIHAADVGISVDTAADILKEEADIILLKKDLSVLEEGVVDGRRTFANTMKYIFMATSANFGNVFSMAISSLFMHFLPLLPKQILLTNLFTDLPEMTISTDRVDQEMEERPLRMDIGFITRFMITFGCISSIFDFATFGVLFLLHANQEQFHTGWFIESVLSASLIVLVIRTQKPFFRSRPSSPLILSTVLTIAATIALPLTPLGPPLGFTPLPSVFYLSIVGILIAYVIAVECAKKIFYKHVNAFKKR